MKKLASAGYIAKGFVYTIIGVLAFMTAFNMGGEKAGAFEMIDFLEKQPLGEMLLAALGLGLVCYAIWHFFQSFQDPENIGSDGKGIRVRISLFISALLYFSIGLFALYDIFGNSSEADSGAQGSSFLSGKTRQYIFIIIGVSLAINAVYQFFKVYTGDFLEKFNIKSMTDISKRKFIKNMGYAGYAARGIVVGIVAYFFIQMGMGTTGVMKGTSEAFSFIQQHSAGSLLLGIVASGLVCYGIYMFTMAKYRSYDD